jgi:hypothetical protein
VVGNVEIDGSGMGVGRNWQHGHGKFGGEPRQCALFTPVLGGLQTSQQLELELDFHEDFDKIQRASALPTALDA